MSWLGPVERLVLERLAELGLETFRPSDLGLPLDRRRLNDALRRLEARGLVRRVARGLYRVEPGAARALGLPVRGAAGWEAIGPLTGTLRARLGGREVTVSMAPPGLAREGYAAPAYLVRGVGISGEVAVREALWGVAVEWRPPHPVAGASRLLRGYWAAVTTAAAILVELVLREAPHDARTELYGWIRARLGPLLRQLTR